MKALCACLITGHCVSHFEYEMGPLELPSSEQACLSYYYEARKRIALQVDALSQTPCAISIIAVLSTVRSNIISAVPDRSSVEAPKTKRLPVCKGGGEHGARINCQTSPCSNRHGAFPGSPAVSIQAPELPVTGWIFQMRLAHTVPPVSQLLPLPPYCLVILAYPGISSVSKSEHYKLWAGFRSFPRSHNFRKTQEIRKLRLFCLLQWSKGTVVP
eukprot:IDg23814t1